MTVDGKEKTTRLSFEAFTVNAIKAMRGDNKGIHSTWTRLDGLNYNQLVKAYYGEELLAKQTAVINVNGVEKTVSGASAVVQNLATAGKIGIRPTKGGVMLYLHADTPQSDAQSALAKIIGK